MITNLMSLIISTGLYHDPWTDIFALFLPKYLSESESFSLTGIKRVEGGRAQ
ncbi:MAG: hypothetical protein GVY19_08185 [Bacteroidetes bacterium]|jgi:hypothetical protein|nr:hypothetical protein [Bacteroidota bacterium]